MKVSEAIDQLEIGDAVWAKATVNAINFEGGYIRAENTKTSIYLDGNAEISLDEPQTEKVEVPGFIDKLIRKYKARNETLFCSIADLYNDSDEYKWYVNNAEIYERAWVNGYTVKPKRWVVKNDRGYVAMENFKDFKNQRVGVKLTITGEKSESLAWDDVDLEKAEAVAVLVEGTVEEV